MTKRTGIILAYDRSTFSDDDEKLLESLAPYLDAVKVGLETMTTEDDNGVSIAALVSAFVGDMLALKVMWDMKLHDIETTVEKAIKNIATNRPGVAMLTLHASNSDGALKAAAKACQEAKILLLAVTVLTDIDEEQCRQRFRGSVDSAVLRFAINAQTCGIGGLVCSPKELDILSKVKETAPMIKVIPGVRPVWAATNDQKRVMTPAEAAKAGANYVVIGRPILKPPQGMSSLEAVKCIREELNDAFPPGSFVDKTA